MVVPDTIPLLNQKASLGFGCLHLATRNSSTFSINKIMMRSLATMGGEPKKRSLKLTSITLYNCVSNQGNCCYTYKKLFDRFISWLIDWRKYGRKRSIFFYSTGNQIPHRLCHDGTHHNIYVWLENTYCRNELPCLPLLLFCCHCFCSVFAFLA